jgi:epoxyqueuosine reductase
MIDKRALKEFAMRVGADDIGIGSLDRFDGVPQEMDPRYYFPEAKSIIGLIFRIPRGFIRGTEEGTNFYQYPSLGYGGINEVIAPTVIYEIGKYIEEQGYEAAPFRNTGGRGSVSDMTGKHGKELSPELHVTIHSETSPIERSLNTRPVQENKPCPDVFIHFRLAAYICGLGEIGYSKMFLSRKFGPLNRQAFILTDAEIEPDEIYNGPELCKKCMACVYACPGNCISRDEQISIKVMGKTITWGKLDEWSCFAYYIGAALKSNPFVDKNVYDRFQDGELLKEGKLSVKADNYNDLMDVINSYYPMETQGYFPPKCGGCLRACYIAMEQLGVLPDNFVNRFRTHKAWKRKI